MIDCGDMKMRATMAIRPAKRHNGLPFGAALWLIGFVLLIVSPARAQDDPPLPIDPTPLAQLMTAQDKTLLGGAHNPKQVIEVYLRIADGHLETALAAMKNNDTLR